MLITGGSGFIGSHLIEELEAHGSDVISLDIRPPWRRHGAVEYVQFDFTQHAVLCELFDRVRPELVCHLGAIPSVQESIREAHASMTANVAGTYSVAEAARRSGARRMLLASSAAVYGATALEHQGRALIEAMVLRPLSPYALAKKQGEEILRMWSSDIWKPIDGVSLRFFNVFGPRQRRDSAYATAIERFLAQWRAGEPLTIVPDGQQRRDMVYVTDVVRAIRLALEAPEPWRGESINIGGGRNYSIFEMARAVGGPEYPHRFIDPRPGEVRASLADIGLARERLGWEPRVSFADGIEQLKQSVPVAS